MSSSKMKKMTGLITVYRGMNYILMRSIIEL
jgi:hypothetical protein